MREDTRSLDVPPDEAANFATHALGLVLAVAGAWALAAQVRGQDDPWRIAGCDVYAVSLVVLYAASTLSHAFHARGPRSFFRMLDQACIFLLIMGTQTPFALAYFRDGINWLLFLVSWGLALVGILYKLTLRRQANVSSLWYLALAWLPIMRAGEIVARLPAGALVLVLLGGGLYTVGVFFLEYDRSFRYSHAIWHLLVIAGSGAHFAAVWRYVAAG